MGTRGIVALTLGRQSHMFLDCGKKERMFADIMRRTEELKDIGRARNGREWDERGRWYRCK